MQYKLLCVHISLLCITVIVVIQNTMANKFLYFAYGSNLLAQRIHINNPSAVRVGIAKLKNYQLDFVTQSKVWKGAVATIVAKNNSHVWGALWELDNIHLESLDRQEGVEQNLYIPLNVEAENSDGKIIKCRTYQQTAKFVEVEDIENVPDVRKPSKAYLKTILEGAKESHLPEEYQKFLKKIPDNGYEGEVEIKIKY